MFTTLVRWALCLLEHLPDDERKSGREGERCFLGAETVGGLENKGCADGCN